MAAESSRLLQLHNHKRSILPAAGDCQILTGHNRAWRRLIACGGLDGSESRASLSAIGLFQNGCLRSTLPDTGPNKQSTVRSEMTKMSHQAKSTMQWLLIACIAIAGTGRAPAQSSGGAQIAGLITDPT